MTTSSQLSSLSTQLDSISSDLPHTFQISDLSYVVPLSFAVLTMQYGFAMVETGYVRPRTTVNILFKNFMNTFLCGVAFFLTGWGLGFGKSEKGLFGTSMFALQNTPSKFIYGSFNFQFSFAAAATTIMGGAMAERTNILAYCILTVFMSGFTYPIVAHWVWHEKGWLNVLGMRDFAGDGPVHLLGGLMGLCGTIFLKPRLGRFSYKTEVIAELLALEEGLETTRGSQAEGEALEIKRKMPGNLSNKAKDILIQRAMQDSPPISSPGYIVFGTIVLWVSWYAFNAGSSGGYLDGKYIFAFTAAANTTISACAGAATGLILTISIERHFLDLRRPINGLLAGLVAITGPCAWVMPWEAFITGVFGTLATFLTENLVNRFRIDDPVSAVAVHCGAGIMGLILNGFFHRTDGLIHGGSGQLLFANIAGILAIIAFGTCCGFFFLMLTNQVVKVRVPLLTEMFGIDAVEHHVLQVDELNPDILMHGIDKNKNEHLYRRMMSLSHDKKSMIFLPKVDPTLLEPTSAQSDERLGLPLPPSLHNRRKLVRPGDQPANTNNSDPANNNEGSVQINVLREDSDSNSGDEAAMINNNHNNININNNNKSNNRKKPSQGKTPLLKL